MVPEQQQQQEEEAARSGGAQEPAAASPQQQQQQQHHHHWRSPPCASPGNPVFSCMLEAALLRARTGLPEPRRLLHKTTSGDYGALAPTAHMAPCRYFPRDNALTDLLFACGKNQHSHGINTGLDKSRVCDHADIPSLTGGGGGTGHPRNSDVTATQ
uniref:Uncharacterized protein n=1 Tax=Sphaerodactylus townsendi TaxID=933632 RepID=A0ACB8E555_9SAUR